MPLFLGKVVKTVLESDGRFQARVQVRIEPMHTKLADTDLPKLKSMNQGDNEFSNLNANDIVYVYTDDDLLQDLYYLGKKASSLSLNDMLSGLERINENLSKAVKSSFTSYNLDNNNIHVINCGKQLFFVNGEENFTLIAEKSNGNIMYVDGDKIDIYKNVYEPIADTDVSQTVVGTATTIKTERRILLDKAGVDISMAHTIHNPDYVPADPVSDTNQPTKKFFSKKITMEKTDTVEDVKIYLNDNDGTTGTPYHERSIVLSADKVDIKAHKTDGADTDPALTLVREFTLDDDQILISIATDGTDSPADLHTITMTEADGIVLDYMHGTDNESKIVITSTGIEVVAGQGKTITVKNDSQSLKTLLDYFFGKLKSAYSGQGLMGNLGAPIIALNPADIAEIEGKILDLDSLLGE